MWCCTTAELAAHLSAIFHIPRRSWPTGHIYFTVRSKSTPGACVISREFIYIRCPTFHQSIQNNFFFKIKSTKSSSYIINCAIKTGQFIDTNSKSRCGNLSPKKGGKNLKKFSQIYYDSTHIRIQMSLDKLNSL